MKTIIELDVPEFQIGQEVSIYFKDTMMIKGIVQAPCGDLISRSTIKHAIYDVCLRKNNIDIFEKLLDRINELPPVNPQKPKTGHWILDETDNSITCDKCGCLIWANDISNGEAYYCPNCGARMVEPQESEG